ncbi:hypothetical protein B0J14DRAFT_687926 [Halenospora varia]|nr:hypothetical protein B0J14DRAFT_687926 [Halenospora varia]
MRFSTPFNALLVILLPSLCLSNPVPCDPACTTEACCHTVPYVEQPPVSGWTIMLFNNTNCVPDGHASLKGAATWYISGTSKDEHDGAVECGELYPKTKTTYRSAKLASNTRINQPNGYKVWVFEQLECQGDTSELDDSQSQMPCSNPSLHSGFMSYKVKLI